MKRILVAVTLLLVITMLGWGQVSPVAADITLVHSKPNVVCGTGYKDSDCHLVSGVLRLNLDRLRVSIPGWRWVIVSRSQWDEVAKSFGVDPKVPAFSSLGVHTTYFDDSLLTLNSGVDERLQAFTSRTGYARLRWVIAHESGHILCNTSDERKAAQAAGRLEFGAGNMCR
jgi:hypothetical protein